MLQTGQTLPASLAVLASRCTEQIRSQRRIAARPGRGETVIIQPINWRGVESSGLMLTALCKSRRSCALARRGGTVVYGTYEPLET